MNFNNYVQKGNAILDELAEELGFSQDRDLAGRILRSVLHALRDRLTIQESFQLMAQLPMIIKGLYVEGWKYSNEKPKIRTIGDFIHRVIHYDQPAAHHDISTVKDGENAIKSVFKVLKNHVSKGEIEDIKAVIPKELHGLWV